MKKWFIVIFILSLLISGFFVFLQIRQNTIERAQIGFNQYGDTITINVSYEKKKFFSELRQLYPEISTKKFLFMNLYSTSAKGMDQIPILDTIIKSSREDMAYLLVSLGPKKETTKDLRDRGISFKNFISANEADSFIRALSREIKNKPIYLWEPYKYLPFNIICDSSGKILYLDTTQAFSGFKMDRLIDQKHAQTLRKAISTIK